MLASKHFAYIKISYFAGIGVPTATTFPPFPGFYSLIYCTKPISSKTEAFVLLRSSIYRNLFKFSTILIV